MIRTQKMTATSAPADAAPACWGVCFSPDPADLQAGNAFPLVVQAYGPSGHPEIMLCRAGVFYQFTEQAQRVTITTTADSGSHKLLVDIAGDPRDFINDSGGSTGQAVPYSETLIASYVANQILPTTAIALKRPPWARAMALDLFIGPLTACTTSPQFIMTENAALTEGWWIKDSVISNPPTVRLQRLVSFGLPFLSSKGAAQNGPDAYYQDNAPPYDLTAFAWSGGQLNGTQSADLILRWFG